MPLLEKLRVFLDGNGAEYTHTVHSIAYTARDVASAEHLPAREVAKTVVIHGDNGYHMLVLPANRLVDFQEVRDVLGFTHARMVPETELARLFPDCELGAMPPFGNLYGMPVYLDSGLAADSFYSRESQPVPCNLQPSTDFASLFSVSSRSSSTDLS